MRISMLKEMAKVVTTGDTILLISPDTTSGSFYLAKAISYQSKIMILIYPFKYVFYMV
jgi:hypothetical protein